MAKNQERELFIGIDLGTRDKKTTGLCILEKRKEGILPFVSRCQDCQDVVGKDIFKKISKYLKETKVIAVDGPLTKGRGKGMMRLYEKFLSTSIFRKEKVAPLPPALMPEFSSFAREVAKKLEKKGFILDLNLIEVFPTLIKKIVDRDLFLKSFARASFNKNFGLTVCKNENQKSAFICALMASLHFRLKTRYLGYRDGFLFLPEASLWKNEWREKFYRAWKEKPGLHYRYLITNIFSK